MSKPTFKQLSDLYASLNSDYISLKNGGITFNSLIAEKQQERLDKVWKLLEEQLETKSNQEKE